MFKIIRKSTFDAVCRENKMLEFAMDKLREANEHAGNMLELRNRDMDAMREAAKKDGEYFRQLNKQLDQERQAGRQLMAEQVNIIFRPGQGCTQASLYLQYHPALYLDRGRGQKIEKKTYAKLVTEFQPDGWIGDPLEPGIYRVLDHCPTFSDILASLQIAQNYLQDKLDKAKVDAKLAKVFSDDKQHEDKKGE